MPKQTFEEWKAKVDAHVEATCGLGTDDLADVAYRDWYEDGMSPKAAARKALVYNDFHF